MVGVGTKFVHIGTALLLATLLLLPALSQPAEGLYTTSPIIVEGDGGFSSAGFIGNGTAADPYVLSEVHVYAYQEFHGIFIANTTKHFRIVDCTVTDAFAPDRNWLNVSASGSGIILYNVSNGTVIDFIGEYNVRGVTVANCRNVTITSSILSNNIEAGVYFNGCAGDDCRVSNCTFTNPETGNNGVLIEDCQGVTVRDNVLEMGVAGISLIANAGYCTDNTVTNNEVRGQTSSGIILDGEIHTSENSVVGNAVSGIATGSGIHVKCGTMENVAGNQVSGCLYGIRLGWSGNTVSGNVLANNTRGIMLEGGADLNAVLDNSMENGEIGVYVSPSQYNVVNNNTISGMDKGNASVGVYLGIGAVRNATISNNTITDCTVGIRAATTYSQSITGLLVSSNDVSNSLKQGMYLLYVNSSQVQGNIFQNNAEEGIYLARGSGNVINANALLFNKGSGRSYSSVRAQAYCGEEGNNWYLGTGNLWADWLSPDEDENGIVDQPYLMPEDCQDPFPLTSIPGLTIPADLIAPEVVRYVPQGTSVDHESAISVTFSEDMDTGSVTVIVSNITRNGVWNDRTCSVNMSLEFETDYYVRVTGRDLVGNNMTDFQWTFRTEGPNATVSGTVRSENYSLLDGVKVSCGNQTSYTDVDGRFSLVLSPGNHTLLFSAEGYLDGEVNVTVLPGHDLDVGAMVLNEVNTEEDAPFALPYAIFIAVIAVLALALLVIWWWRRRN